MKRMVLIFASLLFILTTASNVHAQWYNDNTESASLSTGDKAKIEWEEQSIDLGNIRLYSQKEVTFVMKNTGGKPVMILDAKKSCGCTAVDYPRKPIMPGKKAKVTVSYDAEDLGVFKKDVSLVMSEGTKDQVIHFHGEVVK